MVRQTPSDKLLQFACSEFIEELISQPISRRKLKLGSEEIRSAARSLQWEHADELSSSSSDANNVSVSVGERFLKPLRDTGSRKRLDLTVYIGSGWRNTSIRNEEIGIPITESRNIPPVSALPEGLRELLLHIELAFSPDSSGSKLSKKDIVDAVASSAKLGMVNPYIMKYCVKRIRETARSSDIDDLLTLLRAIIRNESVTFNCASDFELILNCLLNTVLDANLLRDSTIFAEEKLIATRSEAINILSSLLLTKVGKFHSAQLVRSILDKLFGPYISETLNLKDMEDLGVISSLAGVTIATKTLCAQFNISDSSTKLLSYLKRSGKIQKLANIFPVSVEAIISELEYLA